MTWSISARALPTIPSIRAGWMRPSTRRRSRAGLAQASPRRTPWTRGAPPRLSPLVVLRLWDLRALAVQVLFLLAEPAVALVDLRDLLVELLVLLVEPALVALELGAALAVLRF